MCSAVFKLDAGSDHKILHRGRDEHFPRARKRRDARSDVDADPADVVATQLDFARVQSRTDLDSLTLELQAQSHSAADSARRAIEGGEYAIAGVLHKPSSVG